MQNLKDAARSLSESDGISVVARSSVYETEPVGEILDQRDFYNATLRIETELEPLDLLDRCKQIEREMGRDLSGPRHGPRPIDIDLLLLGETQLVHDRLTLPHPQVTERRFVLEPLLELDGRMVLPDGTELSKALAAIGSSERVNRVASL